jgi:hypothetical protein
MRPAVNPSITHRCTLKEMTLTRSMAVPAGRRVMFCRGRKILNYADVAVLAKIFHIPKGTTEICVSDADYADIKEWIG